MARRGAQSGGAIHEDFRPIYEWKYEKEAHQPHFLLIPLPGFSKEQIKVSTEGTNTLRIRGERLIGGNKWSRFEEDFRIPDDCNIRGIRAKFESGTLTITMPKKGLITTSTVVIPKKERTQKEKLEAPLIGSNKEKGENIEKEIKEKVMEKVKKSKKDEIIKSSEADEENVKGIAKPKIYFENIEKKDEEKSKVVKENEIDESKKIFEKVKESKKDEVVKEGTSKKTNEDDKEKEKGLVKPKIYFENIKKKDEEKSKVVKKNEIDESKKVIEGLNIAKETMKESEEDGMKKAALKPGYNYEKIKKNTSEELKEKKKKHAIGNIAKIAKKEENYGEVMKGIAKGELGEERQLIVNMGVAVLVIVALGAYIYYGSFK